MPPGSATRRCASMPAWRTSPTRSIGWVPSATASSCRAHRASSGYRRRYRSDRVTSSSRHRLAGKKHLMQRDLADLHLAGLDMRAEQQLDSVRLAGENGTQYLGVLVVGGIDAHLLVKVEPADDADALGHVVVYASHLAIAGGLHEDLVEGFVPGSHLRCVAAAFTCRYQPALLQGLQQGR